MSPSFWITLHTVISFIYKYLHLQHLSVHSIFNQLTRNTAPNYTALLALEQLACIYNEDNMKANEKYRRIYPVVTDDPGSKPDQRHARRRDRQYYIRKN